MLLWRHLAGFQHDLGSFFLEPKCHGWPAAILVDRSYTILFYRLFYFDWTNAVLSVLFSTLHSPDFMNCIKNISLDLHIYSKPPLLCLFWCVFAHTFLLRTLLVWSSAIQKVANSPISDLPPIFHSTSSNLESGCLHWAVCLVPVTFSVNNTKATWHSSECPQIAIQVFQRTMISTFTVL